MSQAAGKISDVNVLPIKTVHQQDQQNLATPFVTREVKVQDFPSSICILLGSDYGLARLFEKLCVA